MGTRRITLPEVGVLQEAPDKGIDLEAIGINVLMAIAGKPDSPPDIGIRVRKHVIGYRTDGMADVELETDDDAWLDAVESALASRTATDLRQRMGRTFSFEPLGSST